ncbi:unnamed protein product [Vicia faba]|uniref:URB1 C-terminal domain-containing protein n=1 Tax=Vicia faba TaxID=3906 RepID=A0AAV0Z601_VICFA|nr:unnamed protein product [Vicia faba]
MSSADHGIRRLAYDTLVIFKNVLEKCQKRKDVMGLRPLMNSVQNSIEESWRRIPLVIALFAAEASCVLLDSSHDHYAAICTFLTQSSTMNMKVIPLFDNFMWRFTETYKLESLHSLLVHVENTSGQRHDINIGCEELLASTIFYLQLLPGINQELLPSVVSALCLLTFGASNLQVGRTILLQDYNTIISSNSLRVQCPLEANPDWRWSFYQPRKDQSLEFTGTGTENMAEYHACQTLLVVVANVLGGKKLESACLSPLDVEISSLIKWERSLLRN